MKFVFLLIIITMFVLTKFYNERDFAENFWIDLFIQIFHTSTLFFLFHIIVSFSYTLLALFCAYLLMLNIDWLIENIKDFFYKTDETTDNNENEKTEETDKER